MTGNGKPAPSTPRTAPGRTEPPPRGNPGKTPRPAPATPAGAGTEPRAPLDFVRALDTRTAGRAWGTDATRLTFHVTVPADRDGALDLRDELTGWLRRRGLDLGLTDDGTDVYLTWPQPRVMPDIPPISGTGVYPAREPGGQPVYVKPVIMDLAVADPGTGDVSLRFCLTNPETDDLGVYRGTIPQETLFRVLFEAGLITRAEGK